MAHRCRSLAVATCVLAVVLIAFVSCTPKTQSGSVTIVINSSSFNPGNVSVTEGTLVTWINEDSQPHTATAIGAFDSGPIAPNGGRWSWVAAIAGTFTYHSLLQPNMAGTITVVVPEVTGQ